MMQFNHRLLNFSEALRCVQVGERLTRKTWENDDIYIFFVPGYSSKELGYKVLPRIDIMTEDGSVQPGWIASQDDMLAEDWLMLG